MSNSKKTLNFICWNVNGIRAWHKKGCLEWMLKKKPDFFCIQETKAHPDQLTEDLRTPDGYESYFDHSKLKKGYSGVAVYTRQKPEKVDRDLYIERKVLDQEGRFIALYYKDFVLINCYFPNGGGAPERLEYKLKFYEAFLKYVCALTSQKKKVIVCGDLNVAHTEIDLARPKENSDSVGFLPVERAWVDRFLAAGFIDTYRSVNPSKRDAYTYWDMKSSARDRNVGWRIDYFIVDESQRKNIKGVKIYEDVYGSDHCPISLDLDL